MLKSSAYVTLDSSVKGRPVQQTKSTFPGNLRLGITICKQNLETGNWSMLNMSENGGSWTTDPGNSPVIGSGEEAFETGENMGGAVQKFDR